MSKDLVQQVDEMNDVIGLLMKQYNPTQIARQLDIPRARVLSHIDNWKNYVSNEADIKEKAKETLARVDEHYNQIIKELWKQYEEADSNAAVKDATGALKVLAQVEKDRANLYQAAGITADDKLTEQLMETERRQEILMQVLREIDCPKCRVQIRKRLAEVTNQAEVIEVVQTQESDSA